MIGRSLKLTINWSVGLCDDDASIRVLWGDWLEIRIGEGSHSKSEYLRNATRPTLVASGAFEKTETKCKRGVENTKDVGYPSLTWSLKLQIAFDNWWKNWWTACWWRCKYFAATKCHQSTKKDAEQKFAHNIFNMSLGCKLGDLRHLVFCKVFRKPGRWRWPFIQSYSSSSPGLAGSPCRSRERHFETALLIRHLAPVALHWLKWPLYHSIT